ncbi:MAG: 4Fe-4S dicluster domain-containing protein [Clostridiales Family XIII bacterium]|jgi:succinate dehydrogenase/fumarate reductase iron-sulfur protein|nr:4Fe-4S dicluster domain-containing protein [Clostridiales Family XIII bacterium]
MLDVKVRRYDPDEAVAHSLEHFYIDAETGDSVLGLLTYIKNNLDETFSFRAFCTNEHCGECGVRVNGRPVLACRETVAEDNLLIEPLAGFPLIRDLVVDTAPTIEKIQSIFPDISSFTGAHEAPGLKSFAPNDSLTFFLSGRCNNCGLCMSICYLFDLNSEALSGPAVFMALARYLMRANTEEKLKELADIAKKHNFLRCTLCGKCKRVCPQNIDSVSVISMIYKMFRSKGLLTDEEIKESLLSKAVGRNDKNGT